MPGGSPGDSDDFPDALRICSGSTVTGQVTKVEDSINVYKIFVKEGHQIQAYLQESGDSNVYLFISAPDTKPIADSGTLTVRGGSYRRDDKEYVDYMADMEGDWYITVYAATDGNTDYTLTVKTLDLNTPELLSVEGITCNAFPSTSREGFYRQGCGILSEYVIERLNVSYTQAWHFPPIIDTYSYAFEASVYLLQGNAEYRIFFEEEEFGTEYYAFAVNPVNGTYAFMKATREDDTDHWTNLVDWTPTSALRGRNATNRMRVERRGDDILLWLNGEFLERVPNLPFQGAEFGLYVRNSEPNSIVHFDNIQMLRYASD